MSTNLIEFQDSEINIYSIYDVLKSSWKFIFKITTVFLVLGILFSFYNPTKFRSSVLVSELSPEQTFYFKNNSLLSKSVGIYYETWYSSAVKKFKEKSILLNEAEIVREKAPHLNPKSIIKAFEIYPIDGENNTVSSSAEIKFSGNFEDYEIFKEILISTLFKINNEIKNEIMMNMKSHIEFESRLVQSNSLQEELENKLEYEELLAQFNEEKKILSEKLAVEILFLEEQAQIARNLNISTPKTEEVYNIRNDQNNLVFNSKDELDFNDNYYNKGYLAIEEEVKALTKRLNNEKYFTNYETKAKLSILKTRLESNVELEIAEAKIEKQKQYFDYSPINTNSNYRVYNFFTDDGVVKEDSDLYIIIFFILLGLFIGSLISIFESNYLKYQSENNPN